MKKPEIIICLGSSCFSRGNKEIIHEIKTFLKEKKLEDQVKFKGSHCFAECSKGPNLKINEELFHGVESKKLIELLREKLDNINNQDD